jgi:hypothetical protein
LSINDLNTIINHKNLTGFWKRCLFGLVVTVIVNYRLNHKTKLNIASSTHSNYMLTVQVKEQLALIWAQTCTSCWKGQDNQSSILMNISSTVSLYPVLSELFWTCTLVWKFSSYLVMVSGFVQQQNMVATISLKKYWKLHITNVIQIKNVGSQYHYFYNYSFIMFLYNFSRD